MRGGVWGLGAFCRFSGSYYCREFRGRGWKGKRHQERGGSRYLSQYDWPCLTAALTPSWSRRPLDKGGSGCVSSLRHCGTTARRWSAAGRAAVCVCVCVCPRVPAEPAWTMKGHGDLAPGRGCHRRRRQCGHDITFTLQRRQVGRTRLSCKVLLFHIQQSGGGKNKWL